LDHEFAPEVNVYASYNRGIKSGGFAVFEPGSKGYAPEQLDAYEVGVKTDLFGHKLFLNISGFYYDYKNIQVTQAGVGFVDTVNAAAARIYGLDMDFQAAVTDRLRVSGGLGLLNSKFTKFDNAVTYGPNAGPAIIIPDASGNHTPLSSPVSGNLTAEYTLPTSVGDFRIGGTVSYNDGSYMDVGNRLRYPSYTLVNAYIGWKDVNKHLGARLWVNNLTNETYYIQRYTTALGDLQMQAPPRTVGGTLSVNF
jgi:iron complex outermembrane receptor protein